jgi:ankyrin repeat protein
MFQLTKFMRFSALFVIINLFVFQSFAQVTINVKNKGAYRAYYTIKYDNYGRVNSLPEQTIDAGGNQTKSVPAGSTNITIKLSFAIFIATTKDLGTVQAGRSGGTVTFKNSTLDASYDWEPDDATSGVGTQSFENINQIYPNGDSELHRAVRDKNATQMQLLIDNQIQHVNTKNARGFTPLHEAVQGTFSPGIDILIHAGADMTIVNAVSETPFVMAVNLGNKEIAQKLIGNGYNAGADEKALETAVRKRNDDMVKFLLDNGADPNKVITQAMTTNNIPMVEMVMDNYAPTLTIDMFKKAVDNRRFDLAKKMVESGIDVVQALDYAILKNAPDVVLACLEKGGDSQKVLKYAIANRKTDLAASAVANYGANPSLVLDEAIKLNQTDVVTLLLDNNADPNIGLTSAINNNKPAFIGMMIDRGAKVSNEQMAKLGAMGDNNLLPKLIEAGGDKNAALGGALSAKKYSTAELLVQAGATSDSLVNVAVTNKQKNLLIAALDGGANPTPGLAPAINNGLTDYAELLFKAGAKTNDANLVKAALSKGNLDMLKLMVDNGTDANLGMLPAVTANNLPAVQMLIEKGGNAAAQGLIGQAVKTKNTQMIELLVKNGANPNDAMKDAVTLGDVSIVKLLIAAGADGSKPEFLIASVAKNNAELTGLLLASGGNPESILDATVNAGAVNILQLLISKGVNVNNHKYLLTAINKNNQQMAAILVKAGCDAGYVDNSGNNMLHLAAKAEADKVVSTLAQAGVKVNELNNAKDMPLHIAVQQGRGEVELVEEFIKAGADVNAKDGAGKTPLALSKGSRIKKRLKEAGGVE